MVVGVFETASELVVPLAISNVAIAVGMASRVSSEATEPSLLFKTVLVCSCDINLTGKVGWAAFRLDGKSGKEGNDVSFGSSVLDGSASGSEFDIPRSVTTII